MCRMMGVAGTMPVVEAMEEFRALAANGAVLPESTCGHGDGWGMAAFRLGRLQFLTKSERPADTDPRYREAAKDLASAGPDIALMHLRKASKGNVTPQNAHPFHVDNLAFCHNGGIRESERIPTYGIAPTGETDSERFFLNIAGRLRDGEAATLPEAVAGAVGFIHDNLPYSSICFLLSDGHSLWAYRDYRATLRPGETEPPEHWGAFETYYTLYHSERGSAVSSQPIAALASDWKLIPNQRLLCLSPDGPAAFETL